MGCKACRLRLTVCTRADLTLHAEAVTPITVSNFVRRVDTGLYKILTSMSVWFTEFALGLCALGFMALAIALRPQVAASGMPRMRLRLAALFTMIWAVVTAIAFHRGTFDPAPAVLFSLAIVGLWVWQLDPFARWQGQPPLLRAALQGSGIIVVVVVLGWMVVSARTEWIPAPTLAVISLLGLALCTLGLFAIEQLYRNAPLETLPAMRWLGLGMGGIMLTELVVFAETLLLGSVAVAPGSAVRALAYALCAVAMIRGARLMPQWQLGLAVSRRVAFYAASFLLVGTYLVLMALTGWLMLRFAGGWHVTAQLAFALLAALGLGLSLFSTGLSARLKVLISTHFYRHRYDYRVEWIRFTRTMSADDPASDVRRRAIQAVAQIVASPQGALWRRAAPHGAFECAAHWPADAAIAAPLAQDSELPAYLQRTAWLVDLRELERHPQLYGGLVVDAVALGAAPDALIVPLLHVDLLYGWIVLARAPGQGDLDFEDRDLLKIAGRHVAAHLAQFDADAQLVEAHQFETYYRMTAFVMHDLKNVAAQLRLISQNAERHRHNQEFVEDSFRTIASAARRMSRLISQLAGGREAGTLQTLDLASCTERAATHCSGTIPVPDVAAAARPTVIADLEQLTMIIEHAIRNAQDATASGGEVHVEVGMRDHRPFVAVIDTGVGMDAQFVRERLFRPFDTTKGARGMGIGAYQIREYLRSLGGDVEVQSEPGRGTRITMVFADQSILSMGRKAG